jgi:quercetin dioxygenase-like cupin family protein
MTDHSLQARFLRAVDHDTSARVASTQRYAQMMIEREDGKGWCRYFETPPGGGSARKLHTHDFDQVYIGIAGSTNVHVEGVDMTMGPGDVVLIPRGAVHHHWNGSDRNTRHIEITAGYSGPLS